MDSCGDPCGFRYGIVDAKHVLFLQHTNLMQGVKHQPGTLKPTCPNMLRTYPDNIPYASVCKLDLINLIVPTKLKRWYRTK